MLQSGSQPSAEGKLALSAAPAHKWFVQSSSAAPEQGTALGTAVLLPSREEWSLCVPQEREEMPESLQRVGLPPSLAVCTFCVLGAELALQRAELALQNVPLSAGAALQGQHTPQAAAGSDFPVSQVPHL